MRRFLSALLLLAIALPGMATTLRVRLWQQHPPPRLLVTSGSHAEWRSCATCRPRDLRELEIKANGNALSVSKIAESAFLVDGSYELMAGGVTVHLSWPTEVRASAGHLLITLTIPLEDYVAGVVTGEAGGIAQEEALNAMAVAARTFAVHHLGRHAAAGYDLCDTTHCQDLRLAVLSQRARDATARTEGELLWYQGKTAATYYHRSCGGWLESGATFYATLQPPPYLPAHADPYCVRKGADEWRGEAGKRDLVAAVRRAGLDAPGDLRMVTVLSRTPGGRALLVRLEGAHPVTLRADTFRLAVGRTLGWQVIRSDAYQVTDAGDHLVFFGRGQGHGVGLCQAGAAEMASEGHNYREILAFYFPGTQLGINAQGLSWKLLGSDRLDILTTAPDQDRQWMDNALRALQRVEKRTGWTATQRPQLRIFPTVAAFRDSTGEPGWVAASTRGRTIRLQPAHVLQHAGTLESTLVHELAHFLVESRARPGLPLWFREGLAQWIADEPKVATPLTVRIEDLDRHLREPVSQQQLRVAYAEAYARVNKLVEQYGAAAVLGWVERKESIPQLAIGN
jgi:stage II sporulation protein D